jgi:hypothetical protein
MLLAYFSFAFAFASAMYESRITRISEHGAEKGSTGQRHTFREDFRR